MEPSQITPDQGLVFFEHIMCGVFQPVATFPDESEAEKYLRGFRDDFQRDNGKLPARDVDYRMEWRPLGMEVTTAQGEDAAARILADIRQALEADAATEDRELPRRAHYLHEAMGRIHAICAAIASGARLPGGRTLAHEIAGISGQALIRASQGERRGT